MNGIASLGRILVVLPVLLGPACGQALEMRAITEYPATTMPGIGITTYARRLGEVTDGHIAVAPTYQSSLGALDALEAVRKGDVEIADVHGGPLGSREPIFGLVSLPLVAASPADARCLQTSTREAYAKRFEEMGLHLLYSAPWPATGLWSAGPVASLSDLRRLRIRTYDQTSAAFVAALGADAISVPMARALPLARDGAISAIMSSGDGGAGQMLWQYFRHFTALNYAAPLSFLLMNKRAYDALPADDRRRVDDIARETERSLWGVMQQRTEINYGAMTANGVVIEASVPDDLRGPLKKLSDVFLASWVRQSGSAAETLLNDYTALRSARQHSTGGC